MLAIDAIKTELSNRLSPKRYQHSLGVADEAKRLANRYGADTEKAYLAGLYRSHRGRRPPDRHFL